MKTHLERFNEMMEKGKLDAGITIDDWKVSLLACIADSLSDIANNINRNPKVIKDRSDIQLANEICLIAAKHTDCEQSYDGNSL